MAFPVMVVEVQEVVLPENSKHPLAVRIWEEKNMLKRKILSVLILCLVAMSLLSGCSTNEAEILVPSPQEDLFVYDQGSFLDDTVEKKTNDMLVQLEEQSTVEFAVITIPSLNDLTIEDYAIDLGNRLGIGKEDKDNGILLLISKSDEKVRLEIGTGLQDILTDSISGDILDEFFVPHRSEGNYEDAVLETVQAIINVLAASDEYSSLNVRGVNPELVVEPTPWYYYLIALIILIVALVVIEWVTGHLFGYGFGDGFITAIARSSGSSSRGGFGGGGFSGGGASR